MTTSTLRFTTPRRRALSVCGRKPLVAMILALTLSTLSLTPTGRAIADTPVGAVADAVALDSILESPEAAAQSWPGISWECVLSAYATGLAIVLAAVEVSAGPPGWILLGLQWSAITASVVLTVGSCYDYLRFSWEVATSILPTIWGDFVVTSPSLFCEALHIGAVAPPVDIACGGVSIAQTVYDWVF